MNTLAPTILSKGLVANALQKLELHPMEHVIDGHANFVPHALYEIGLTKQIVMFFIAALLTILFFGSYAMVAGKKKVPGRWGNLVESVILFIRDQMTRPFMGESGDRFVPVLTSFFVFIAFCNILGLIPFFDYLGHGGNTATGNICITFGLAVCAFTYYHLQGVREQRWNFIAYFKSLFPHVPFFVLPVIVPVELLAHVVRPCALAIRLFANMLAGHTMVAVLLGFTAVWTQEFLFGGGAISIACVIGVTALTFLELLVALIQAFVFTFLTTVFLAGAVHPEH